MDEKRAFALEMHFSSSNPICEKASSGKEFDTTAAAKVEAPASKAAVKKQILEKEVASREDMFIR